MTQTQSTGTPKQLAEKLNCSERMIYTYINYLRNELNAPIAYSRKRSTYYYTEQGLMTLQGFRPYQGRTNAIPTPLLINTNFKRLYN